MDGMNYCEALEAQLESRSLRENLYSRFCNQKLNSLRFCYILIAVRTHPFLILLELWLYPLWCVQKSNIISWNWPFCLVFGLAVCICRLNEKFKCYDSDWVFFPRNSSRPLTKTRTMNLTSRSSLSTWVHMLTSWN